MTERGIFHAGGRTQRFVDGRCVYDSRPPWWKSQDVWMAALIFGLMLAGFLYAVFVFLVEVRS